MDSAQRPDHDLPMPELDDWIFQALNNAHPFTDSSGDTQPSLNSGDSSTSASASPLSSSQPPRRPRRRPIPRKGHTKSRLGCFSCKRRRVKCQESLPSCGNCHRLGLRCEYPSGQDPDQLSLSAPKPSQPLPQTQLSMTDLHFFHHFLVHAYPGLPIQGEQVWREVAQYSHTFDFLAHAVLALGASHLGLCNGTDYRSDALSHRVSAITSLNTALSTPCQTKEEGDARYATLMALTFQSSYMDDGMSEFLAMLRGCSVVANSSFFRFEDSAFRMFSTEGHVQCVHDINGGFDTGLADQGAIDAGLASLRDIAPLSQSVLEVSLVGRLQRILQMSRTSCVGAFGELCRAYQLFGESSAANFRILSDPGNYIAQIIISHFFVIEYVLASIALAPVSPSFPFRKTIIMNWVYRIAQQAPSSQKRHMQWPLEFITENNCNWGTMDSRPGILPRQSSSTDLAMAIRT
ncbi:hypothetical protein CC79DRAFT_1372337 [Sarocladium strictum]